MAAKRLKMRKNEPSFFATFATFCGQILIFNILFYPLDPRNPRLVWTAESRLISDIRAAPF